MAHIATFALIHILGKFYISLALSYIYIYIYIYKTVAAAPCAHNITAKKFSKEIIKRGEEENTSLSSTLTSIFLMPKYVLQQQVYIYYYF